MGYGKTKKEFSSKLEWLSREEYKLYHVVDGQQRLTTILILLNLFLQSNNRVDDVSKNEKFMQELLYVYETEFSIYKFGYEADDPSFRFFKENIIVIPEEWNDIGKLNTPIINTYYTNNLTIAKEFFKEKIKSLTEGEIKEYFQALRLRFGGIRNIIDNEKLNIYMIFETMNSRGRELTNMELLKNRLIYLATLLPEEDRLNEDYVNQAWKIIYKYLGLNQENPLDDDEFLRNHWIMYGNYSRKEEEFYKQDLLSKVFIVPNIDSQDSFLRITKDRIKEYVDSLEESVSKWYVIHTPKSDFINKCLTIDNDTLEDEKKVLIGFTTDWSEIRFELLRLNRLGMRYFEPLILAAFMDSSNSNKMSKLLSNIERYLFLSFNVSMRRSNYGSATFYPLAKNFYHTKRSEDLGVNIDSVIDTLDQWSNNSVLESEKYDMESFMVYIKDLFLRDLTFGYRNWNGINYFLQEYENSCRIAKGESVIDEAYSRGDVEFIAEFLKSGKDEENLDKKIKEYKKRDEWKMYSRDQIKRILCSLGNLSLGTDANLLSNNELSKWYENSKWTPTSILKRGVHLLTFLEKRWIIKLGDKNEKKKILFLEFME